MKGFKEYGGLLTVGVLSEASNVDLFLATWV